MSYESHSCRLVCMLLVWLSANAAATTSRAEDHASGGARAPDQEFVNQLGDERYLVRERAAVALLKRGLDAIPALEQGCKHTDREVRYRCERLLVVVRDREQDRRLDAFLHNYDRHRAYNFPGWERFRLQYGDAAPARALFTDMYLVEPDLLAAIDRGPKAAADALTTRSQALQQLLQAVPQELPVSMLATLLFAASDEKVDIPAQLGSMMLNFCSHVSFSNAITSGGHKDLLRRLLIQWILRKEESLSYYNLTLVMRYEIKEGLVVAERILRGPASQPYVRQLAIVTVAKFRDESRIPLLEGCLDDKSVYTTWQPNNNVMIQTQIRDVALAGLLVMHRQDPKQFGFERLQMEPQMVFNAATAGFESDEKRAASMHKWQEFRSAQKKNAG